MACCLVLPGRILFRNTGLGVCPPGCPCGPFSGRFQVNGRDFAGFVWHGLCYRIIDDGVICE